MQQIDILFIQLARSKLLLVYLVIVHVTAICLVLNFLPVLWSVFVSILLVVHFLVLARQNNWLRSSSALSDIEFSSAGQLSLSYGVQSKQSAELVSSYIGPWFVILRLKAQNYFWMKTVFIAVDAVDKESFRRLRVYLKDTKLYLK